MGSTIHYAVLAVAVATFAVGGRAAGVQGAWEIDAASSATISFIADRATIHGPQNAHALARQSAPATGTFRFSASIRAPEAAELAPALFVYWSPENWVRLGHLSAHSLYHVHGPGIYGVVCEDGRQTQYRLTFTSSRDFRYNLARCDLEPVHVAQQWQHVAIALDKQSVHFQLGDGSGSWKSTRTIARSGAFEKAPPLLLLGKGHYEAGRFNAPALANDLPEAGPIAKAEFQSIEVAALDAENTLEAAPANGSEPDEYGIRELSQPGDPNFDSIASHWPPLQYTRDAIGVPDHPQEFTVLPNGMLLAVPNGQLLPGGKHQRAWFKLGTDGIRFGGKTTVSRELLEGWLPVLTCGWQDGPLQYEQTIAAWSEGMSPDQPMLALLRLRVTNSSDAATTTRLGLFSESENKEIAAVEELPVAPLGSVSTWFEMPFPAKGEPLSARRIEQQAFESRLSEVCREWRSRVGNGMQVDVPEPRVMNAWRAWQCWQLTNVDKVNDAYEYHDGGGGFYELVYGFSACRAAQQADLLGRSTDARRWIEAMMKMGTPDGQFFINYGLPDQGSLLQAIVHHYDFSRDKEWLKKVAPTLVKMCEWGRNARAKAKAETPTTSPAYGMIHARPYCDHPGNAYFLPGDILLANGMRSTARVLKEIGNDSDARRIDAEATSYISDLHRIVDASIFQVDGQDLLPLFPESRGLLRAAGWTARDYYALLAPLLLEEGGEVIPPDSRPARIVYDALEKRGGLLMGLPHFWGGIDHAYGGSYWSYCLSNNEPEKALLALYGSMAYGMSRDTFASVEVTFCKEGKNFGTLPHNYSNLEQLRLLRNLLVMEQGESLALGCGIARHWLAAGQHVEVRNAVTRWGEVSYRLESSPDGNSLTAKLKLPAQLPKNGAKLHLRHERSMKVKHATIRGATLAEQGYEHLVLQNPTGEVQVQVSY